MEPTLIQQNLNQLDVPEYTAEANRMTDSARTNLNSAASSFDRLLDLDQALASYRTAAPSDTSREGVNATMCEIDKAVTSFYDSMSRAETDLSAVHGLLSNQSVNPNAEDLNNRYDLKQQASWELERSRFVNLEAQGIELIGRFLPSAIDTLSAVGYEVSTNICSSV